MITPSEALNREFVLDDQSVLQAGPESDVISVTTHAVVIGDVGLLLPSDEVSELVERSPVCKLPNTPTWFSGVISLRGNITPVFDLHFLFALSRRGPAHEDMGQAGRGDQRDACRRP